VKPSSKPPPSRLREALKAARAKNPWDMPTIRLAGRRYLADFEEATRRFGSSR
jgi:hypothetical protein